MVLINVKAGVICTITQRIYTLLTSSKEKLGK